MSKWYRVYLKNDGNMARGGTADGRERPGEKVYANPETSYVYQVNEEDGKRVVKKYDPSSIHDKTFMVYHFRGKQEIVDIHEIIVGKEEPPRQTRKKKAKKVARKTSRTKEL